MQEQKKQPILYCPYFKNRHRIRWGNIRYDKFCCECFLISTSISFCSLIISSILNIQAPNNLIIKMNAINKIIPISTSIINVFLNLYKDTYSYCQLRSVILFYTLYRHLAKKKNILKDKYFQAYLYIFPIIESIKSFTFTSFNSAYIFLS